MGKPENSPERKVITPEQIRLVYAWVSLVDRVRFLTEDRRSESRFEFSPSFGGLKVRYPDIHSLANYVLATYLRYRAGRLLDSVSFRSISDLRGASKLGRSVPEKAAGFRRRLMMDFFPGAIAGGNSTGENFRTSVIPGNESDLLIDNPAVAAVIAMAMHKVLNFKTAKKMKAGERVISSMDVAEYDIPGEVEILGQTINFADLAGEIEEAKALLDLKVGGPIKDVVTKLAGLTLREMVSNDEVAVGSVCVLNSLGMHNPELVNLQELQARKGGFLVVDPSQYAGLRGVRANAWERVVAVMDGPRVARVVVDERFLEPAAPDADVDSGVVDQALRRLPSMMGMRFNDWGLNTDGSAVRDTGSAQRPKKN